MPERHSLLSKLRKTKLLTIFGRHTCDTCGLNRTGSVPYVLSEFQPCPGKSILVNKRLSSFTLRTGKRIHFLNMADIWSVSSSNSQTPSYDLVSEEEARPTNDTPLPVEPVQDKPTEKESSSLEPEVITVLPQTKETGNVQEIKNPDVQLNQETASIKSDENSVIYKISNTESEETTLND